MTLTDADVEVLMEAVARALDEHRDGPMQVAIPYTPRKGEMVVVVIDYDKQETMQ